jgi:O-antigen ligase
VLLNCFFLILYDPLSLLSIEFLLKLSLPVYLFFFLRLFINDLRDLHGILQSFLYAGVFVAGLLLFEVFVNPIGIEESRGLQRIQGSFGDVVSYGMYIVFALITVCYFFFSRNHLIGQPKRLILIGVVVGFGILGLVNIHHTATYTVFLLVVMLFLLFNFRKGNMSTAFLLVLAAGLALSYFGSSLVQEKITPLIETDLAVYSGEEDTDRLLHGRVGRWRIMLEKFSSEMVPVQFFGYSLKFDYVFQFIGIGSHNDFIRILFATGILGLVLYLRFLVVVFRRNRGLGPAQRFLLYASYAALLFYSISVTPTFYAPFMYFAMAIFAFVALPEKNRLQWKNRAY